MLISGDGPDRRIYWSDVEQVREIRGPPYQLSLRRLLPGPYLPHTLLRGETILEIVARPATRVLLRRALVGGFGSLHEDVLSHVPKEAALDLHVRWWRD